jgi:hypothetical protein
VFSGASGASGAGSNGGGARTSSEAGLVSPHAGAARKAAKPLPLPDWTTYVKKDTEASKGTNTYYFCTRHEDCRFAEGAVFVLPRVRSSFSGGRKAWCDHVISCVDPAELLEVGVTKLSGSGCVGVLTLEDEVVKVALSHVTDARAGAAKKKLLLEAEQAGGKQLTLEEARLREIGRRHGLTEAGAVIAVTAAIASCAVALRTIDNPQYREACQQLHDLGWQRGYEEGMATAKAAQVRGSRPRDAQPQTLNLPHRTALTRTYLPRLVRDVYADVDALYAKAATEGGGALGIDGWEEHRRSRDLRVQLLRKERLRVSAARATRWASARTRCT